MQTCVIGQMQGCIRILKHGLRSEGPSHQYHKGRHKLKSNQLVLVYFICFCCLILSALVFSSANIIDPVPSLEQIHLHLQPYSRSSMVSNVVPVLAIVSWSVCCLSCYQAQESMVDAAPT
jgi:hypothetical protein